MKRFYLGLLIMSASTIQSQKFPGLKAPIADKQEHIREIHGDKVNDPYYWMIDYFPVYRQSELLSQEIFVIELLKHS